VKLTIWKNLRKRTTQRHFQRWNSTLARKNRHSFIGSQ